MWGPVGNAVVLRRKGDGAPENSTVSSSRFRFGDIHEVLGGTGSRMLYSAQEAGLLSVQISDSRIPTVKTSRYVISWLHRPG